MWIRSWNTGSGPSPWKITKLFSFLAILVPIPWKITKLPLSSHYSMLDHHRNASESLVGLWWPAFSGIWIFSILINLKKHCQSWVGPLLTRLPGYVHAWPFFYVHGLVSRFGRIVTVFNLFYMIHPIIVIFSSQRKKAIFLYQCNKSRRYNYTYSGSFSWNKRHRNCKPTIESLLPINPINPFTYGPWRDKTCLQGFLQSAVKPVSPATETS